MFGKYAVNTKGAKGAKNLVSFQQDQNPLTTEALKLISTWLGEETPRKNLTDAKDGVVSALKRMQLEKIFDLFVKIGADVKAQKDNLGVVCDSTSAIMHWRMKVPFGKGRNPFEYAVKTKDDLEDVFEAGENRSENGSENRSEFGPEFEIPICYFHGICDLLPGWNIIGCIGAKYADGAPKYLCSPIPFWEAMGMLFVDTGCHLAGKNHISLLSESFLIMVFAMLHHLEVPIDVQMGEILRIGAGNHDLSDYGRMMMEAHVVELLTSSKNKISAAANLILCSLEYTALAKECAQLRGALTGEKDAVKELHAKLEAARGENNRVNGHLNDVKKQKERLELKLKEAMKGLSVPQVCTLSPEAVVVYPSGLPLAWTCGGCGYQPTMCGEYRAVCGCCMPFDLCRLSPGCEAVAGYAHDCVSPKVIDDTWSCQRPGCTPGYAEEFGKRYCKCQDKSVELCMTHDCMMPASYPHNCASVARAHMGGAARPAAGGAADAAGGAARP
ncbi:MAG: hypothetical protein EBU46_16830 [Nitrosomonadaceae bacterium]|nr:hypothetical protein [Nitrosomonadaceae bacterium]